MPQQSSQWQIKPTPQLSEEFLQAIRRYAPEVSGNYAAQLLWQRGICETHQLAGFLKPQLYQPASPFEFGQEMQWGVQRLLKARTTGEIVAIWGDFDADGITATAVLWQGLGQFFPRHHQLFYYIPNRLTESHGLNNQGIDELHQMGCQLIVTCDTGSTNLSEIKYACQLGIDVIVTDHHTLPAERPPVTAIINPRYLSSEHPLFHLSGVAVAYKLVEALYQTQPDIPQQPLEDLLDLVAIGLIADLVQLSGDCRYLAQRGIEVLQQQAQKRTRPGIAKLLELCQKNGDRPTDISFGLGPRINAVSRIQGDASFCVELLTSRDEKHCTQLALETELANARRKSLQKDVFEQVKKKLSQLDLSTTSVIVLWDFQWPVGVLGLVAGQVAQEYGRPTILLSVEEINELDSGGGVSSSGTQLARGSARSVNNIDLYQLVKSQEQLLHRFGGHPFAAGLSLPVENIPLFTEAINQQLRQLSLATGVSTTPTVQADLVCTVQELGKDLFRELKLLEPCGMGNPVPRLLIQNCWFENVWNRNTQDLKGQKVQYIKTEFEIWDHSAEVGFPGLWWGHYKEDLPQGLCDAIVELDYNNYKRRAEVRLVAVQPSAQEAQFNTSVGQLDWILDYRQDSSPQPFEEATSIPHSSLLTLQECPTNWSELQVWFRLAIQTNQKLAIAYSPPEVSPPSQIWQQLIGIAKYLSRTGQSATRQQLYQKLHISERTLELGLQALSQLGFQVEKLNSTVQITQLLDSADSQGSNEQSFLALEAIDAFLSAVQEEQFRQNYFYQVPLSTIQAMAAQTVLR